MEIKLVDILVERIKNHKINPVTNEVFKLEDIKYQNYREEVEKRLMNNV